LSKIILSLVFICLAIQIQAQQATPADDLQIRQVLDGYYEAWNRHDTQAMAKFYAPDGDLRTPWNEIGKNRKEVAEIYAKEHANQMKDARIEKNLKSIRMIKPDFAFVDVESTITGMNEAGEERDSPLHHHVVYVLARRDGNWQILIGRPF